MFYIVALVPCLLCNIDQYYPSHVNPAVCSSLLRSYQVNLLITIPEPIVRAIYLFPKHCDIQNVKINKIQHDWIYKETGVRKCSFPLIIDSYLPSPLPRISYKIVDKYVHTLLVYPIGVVSGIYFQLNACSKIYPMPIDDPIRPFDSYLSHCNLFHALCQDFKEVFAVFSPTTHPTVVSLSFATATWSNKQSRLK